MSNEQKIIDMYTKQSKSTYQISKELNTYPNKIRRILRKNGVEMKDRSEAQKNALAQGVSKIPTQGHKRSEKEKIKIDMQTTKHKINISQELLELLDQGKIYYKLN